MPTERRLTEQNETAKAKAKCKKKKQQHREREHYRQTIFEQLKSFLFFSLCCVRSVCVCVFFLFCVLTLA